MILEIPEELIKDQLANQIVSIVLREVDKRLDMISKVNDLPPYPNKSQVKKVLVIGNDKLETWISEGLKVQIWSNKDHRIERDELKRFLSENKEI